MSYLTPETRAAFVKVHADTLLQALQDRFGEDGPVWAERTDYGLAAHRDGYPSVRVGLDGYSVNLETVDFFGDSHHQGHFFTVRFDEAVQRLWELLAH